MRKHIYATVTALFISAMSFGTSYALPITFEFFGTSSSGNVNVGHQKTYLDTSNTYGVDAYAWDYNDGIGAWDSESILENNRGNREQGLGVLGNFSEIDLTEIIELNLTAANSAGLSDWKIRFNSVDNAEVAMLYGSNSRINSGNPTSLTQLLSIDKGLNFVNNTVWWDIGNTDWNYLYIIEKMGSGSSGDDVLVYGLQASPVPEPATMLLFGAGLAGLVGLRSRTKK